MSTTKHYESREQVTEANFVITTDLKHPGQVFLHFDRAGFWLCHALTQNQAYMVALALHRAGDMANPYRAGNDGDTVAA